jgi:hypothetical protein
VAVALCRQLRQAVEHTWLTGTRLSLQTADFGAVSYFHHENINSIIFIGRSLGNEHILNSFKKMRW